MSFGTRASLSVLLLLLSGCGSCQQRSETDDGAGASDRVERPASATKARPGRGGAAASRRIRVPTMGAGPDFPPTTELPPPVIPPVAPRPGGEPERAGGDCVVIIDAIPDFGEPPLEVRFSVEAQCVAGVPVYTWAFGDDTGSSDPAPVHIYERPGEYLVTLRATAPDGTRASDDITITVEESPSPEQ